jgi:hypothetical protein
MTEQFIITKQWLDSWQTKKGGYTKLQVEALGLKWPLTKGWKNRIIGNELTYPARVNFEYYAEKPNIKQVREVLTIDNCIAYLFKNKDKMNLTQEYKLSAVKKNFK